MKIIIGLIISTALLQSCEKAPTGSTADGHLDTAKFTRNALPFVNLAYGKHWVYKDSATGTLDSVVLTKSKLDKILVPEETVYCGDWCSYRIAAHYSETFDLILTKFTGSAQSEWLNASATAYLDSDGIYDTLHMTLYCYNTMFYGPVFSMHHLDAANSSITVESHTYEHVFISTDASYITFPEDPGYYVKRFYWSPGVGLIRYELYTNSSTKVLTLLRHN